MSRPRATLLLDLGKDQADFEMLDKIDEFARLKGWSRKRIFLMGVAELMARDKTNPELLLNLVEYISRKR